MRMDGDPGGYSHKLRYAYASVRALHRQKLDIGHCVKMGIPGLVLDNDVTPGIKARPAN